MAAKEEIRVSENKDNYFVLITNPPMALKTIPKKGNPTQRDVARAYRDGVRRGIDLTRKGAK